MAKKTLSWRWGVFAVALFILFVLLQLPASWLIAKFYKNNTLLQNVSGNIWVGQADWQYRQFHGSVSWNTRPLDLFWLRLGANVEVRTGNSLLAGQVGYGLGKRLILKDVKGQLAPDTLQQMVNWQWPSNALQHDIEQLRYQSETGFSQTNGQLNWTGGLLQYNVRMRDEKMNVPSLKATLSDEAGKLKLDVRDTKDQKMANFSLDQQLMLDSQLTQRLLLNVPTYSGQASLDSAVISLRQPLMNMGSN